MSEVKVFKVWNGWNPYFIDGPITDKEEELVFKADFDAVVKERDELRAENERLKAEFECLVSNCEWYADKGTDQERHHFLAVEARGNFLEIALRGADEKVP